MLAYTYIKQGKFELIEKPKPELKEAQFENLGELVKNTIFVA